MTALRLVSAGGDTIAMGAPAFDPADRHMIVAPLSTQLAPGAYRLAWTIASRDGHVVRGTVAFSVRESTTADTGVSAQTPAGSGAPPEHQIEPVAFSGAVGAIGAKWLWFISLFTLIGVLVFRSIVLRRASPGEADAFTQIASTNSATLGIAAAIGAVLATLFRLARESADIPDIPLATILSGSLWGWAVLTQLAGAIASAVAFGVAHRQKPGTRRGAWGSAAAAVLLTTVATSLSGHAVAGDLAFIAVPVDLVHLIAGSAWLGTLGVIVTVAIPAAFKTPDSVRPGERVAGLINIFSPLALTCGATAVATGILSSVLQLKRADALWTTPYGIALVIKLLFVMLLFAAGAWNWRRMKPRLTGDNAVVPLQSVASLELLLATVVLGITAALVSLELP